MGVEVTQVLYGEIYGRIQLQGKFVITYGRSCSFILKSHEDFYARVKIRVFDNKFPFCYFFATKIPFEPSKNVKFGVRSGFLFILYLKFL